MKKKKGLTLVELLIAIALLSIIGVVISRLLWIPTQAKVASEKEFHVQSSLRSSSQLVNNSVRDASAVFLLTKQPPKNLMTDLTPKWDYLICEEKDGYSTIVHYKWSKTSNKHERKVIAQAKAEEVNFLINFETAEGGKLLNYEVVAHDLKTGREDKVETELKPLNSFNVTDNSKFDYVLGKKVGNCLAFRNDIIDPELGGEVGYDTVAVSLVMDLSSSMIDNLDGYQPRTSFYPYYEDGKHLYYVPSSFSAEQNELTKELKKFVGNPSGFPNQFKNWVRGTTTEHICRKISVGSHRLMYYHKKSFPFDETQQRLYILKKQAKQMIDKLMTSPNANRIHIAIHPFSYKAYAKGAPNSRPVLKYEDGPILDLKNKKFTALKEIKEGSIVDNSGILKGYIDSMECPGGTNTGDGIRWGYYKMLQFNTKSENVGKRIKNFFMVLTDGVASYYTDNGGGSLYLPKKNDLKNLIDDKGLDETALRCVGENNKAQKYMLEMAKYIEQFPKWEDEPDQLIDNISEVNKDEKVDATVIGFSNLDNDNAQCDALGQALGADAVEGRYFIKAGTEADLSAAFQKFSDKILEKASLWYVVAPE